MNDMPQLINQAQTGNGKAKDELIRLMLNDGYMRQINKYLYVTRLLSPHDIQSEFWLGVIKAIPRVRHDIGNPLQFLTFKGICRIKSLIRTRLSKAMFYSCRACGHEGKIRGSKYKCKACGSESIEFSCQEIPCAPENLRHGEKLSHHRERIDIQEKVEKLKQKLSPQELKVFKLIVEKGYTSANSVNYLEDIGTILDITPQCVAIYLRRIRSKYRALI